MYYHEGNTRVAGSILYIWAICSSKSHNAFNNKNERKKNYIHILPAQSQSTDIVIQPSWALQKIKVSRSQHSLRSNIVKMSNGSKLSKESFVHLHIFYCPYQVWNVFSPRSSTMHVLQLCRWMHATRQAKKEHAGSDCDILMTGNLKANVQKIDTPWCFFTIIVQTNPTYFVFSLFIWVCVVFNEDL